jgi:branched-chain amino acid transport system substrate-binding protein
MLFEAMRRAGTVTDTSKVRGELEKLADFPGVLGKLNWTGKANYGVDHQLAVPFYVAEIKNGVEVIRARCTVAEGCN